MKVFPPLLAAGAASVLLPALLPAPAQAHGSADGGALQGLLHPLLGGDHLLMLVAVGVAAALLSPGLLLWALGGGLAGALLGAAGLQLPGLEALAALAVPGVALWCVLARPLAARRPAWPLERLSGGLVAAAVMLHGMLHGLEAPAGSGGLAWWAGALLASIALCGGTALLLRRPAVAASLPGSLLGPRRPSR